MLPEKSLKTAAIVGSVRSPPCRGERRANRPPGGPRERFFVHNFKINQSCAVAARIVDYILGSAIAVGPAATEMVAPKLMSAAKFSTCGLQHSACERAAIQVHP